MPSRRLSMTLPMRDSTERRSRSVTIRGSPPPSTSAARSALDESKKNRLIVGIDYGTTFTSVAYTYIKAGQDARSGSLGVRLQAVNHISSWPGATETPFVPTVSLYTTVEGSPSEPKWWGYKVARIVDRKEAPASAYQVQLAKLLLHKAKETEEETRRLERLARKGGKNKIDFIRDFLRQLHEYLLGENGYFREHHSYWLEDTEIEFIFGVPAAWSEPEQQAMVQAAIEAGFDNPSRGSEPEAMAAIYFAQHETSLQIGDTFVICDAGGGTVDLISYTVAELNPLRVNEASVAEGVLCGSTYLNRNLRNTLKKKIEKEHYLRGLDDILDKATTRFDLDFKKGFEGDEGEWFSIPGLRNNAKKGFKENRIWLSSDELKKDVFDPIVDQIEHIIHKQIEFSRAISKKDLSIRPDEPNIVLGGGFASNKYLSTRLKQAFSQTAEVADRIELQTLSSAATTVARGLVLMSSRYGMVKQRRSKMSYGVFTYLDYDEDLHGSEKDTMPVLDPLERDRDHRQIKVIDWFVRKGQPIKNEEIFIRERNKNIASDTQALVERIFVCDHETSDEEYTLMADKPQNCSEFKIETDISELSKSDNFEKPPGRNFYKLYWDICLSIYSNQMIWSIILKTKTGQNIAREYSPMSFDADETRTKSLGSLASRWENGPVKPLSQFGREPVFSRKRARRDEEAEPSGRKVSRKLGRPRTKAADIGRHKAGGL